MKTSNVLLGLGLMLCAGCQSWQSSSSTIPTIAGFNPDATSDAAVVTEYKDYTGKKGKCLIIYPYKEKSKPMVWQTMPVPKTADKGVNFDLGVGFGTGKGVPSRYYLFVNGKKLLVFDCSFSFEKTWSGPDGAKLSYSTLRLDKFDDSFGRMNIYLPCSWYTPGKAVKLKTVPYLDGSWGWFMVNTDADLDLDIDEYRRESGILRQLEQLGIYENSLQEKK